MITTPLPIDPRDNSGDDKHLACPAGSGVYAQALAPTHAHAEEFAGRALAWLDARVAADPGFAKDVQPLGGVTGWRVVELWQLPHSARAIFGRAARQWRRQHGRPPVIVQAWRLTDDRQAGTA